ncbi:FAD-binding oxidoreductase [Mangrovicoccus sp. HB161399]|uniref:FAD-binding oxidoreductase n=1 Tax=Mangrovicoccus sp. HB161399 TaxID=2720392 RepID=UPI0015550CFE|nr:FAD-binding oxidoreductase [Mangrovicoccus sp. HB161399]
MTQVLEQGLADDLLGLLGPKGVRTGAEMAPWLTDFRHRMTGTAAAVALPASTAEAAAAVRAATSRGLPVFPQGGNTGLCYGAVPKDGLVVALPRMRGIRHFDRASGLLTVEAGMTLTEVHDFAAAEGLQFPLHLGSEGTAQIGGLISTNAGGTGVLRYGAMRDLVAGVELVLADGRVLDDLAALPKDNRGYPLRHMVAGAEGTLGLVTAATLRLTPAMQDRAHAWLAVDTAEQALELAARLRAAAGDVLEALELLDRAQVSYVQRHIPGTRMPFAATPAWSLLVELASARADAGMQGLLESALESAFEDGLIADAVIAQSEGQGAEIWHFRHSVTEANAREGVGVVMDTSVRPGKIAQFIAEADAVAAARFPEAERAITAHIGDGNVHYIVMFPHALWARHKDPIAKEMEVETAIHDVVARHGGSFSAEHGIGRKLASEMARLGDPVRLEILRGIKAAFDPQGLMNPGVLLPGA